MISDKERKDIDEILDCFDFCKVKKVMEFLEWTWGFNKTAPEMWELRKEARRLLEDCFNGLSNNSEYQTSCGGFVVSGNTYPLNTKKYVNLSFQVADWDNYN